MGQEARISLAEARQAAGAVTAALEQHCSPGQVETVVAQLPHGLRELLRPAGGIRLAPGASAAHTAVAETPARHPATEERIERDVEAIGDAVRALVQGFAELPTEEPSADRPARAARRAHQILLGLGATK